MNEGSKDFRGTVWNWSTSPPMSHASRLGLHWLPLSLTLWPEGVEAKLRSEGLEKAWWPKGLEAITDRGQKSRRLVGPQGRARQRDLESSTSGHPGHTSTHSRIVRALGRPKVCSIHPYSCSSQGEASSRFCLLQVLCCGKSVIRITIVCSVGPHGGPGDFHHWGYSEQHPWPVPNHPALGKNVHLPFRSFSYHHVPISQACAKQDKYLARVHSICVSIVCVCLLVHRQRLHNVKMITINMGPDGSLTRWCEASIIGFPCAFKG